MDPKWGMQTTKYEPEKFPVDQLMDLGRGLFLQICPSLGKGKRFLGKFPF